MPVLLGASAQRTQLLLEVVDVAVHRRGLTKCLLHVIQRHGHDLARRNGRIVERAKVQPCTLALPESTSVPEVVRCCIHTAHHADESLCVGRVVLRDHWQKPRPQGQGRLRRDPSQSLTQPGRP